jgi:hypothetical protein
LLYLKQGEKYCLCYSVSHKLSCFKTVAKQLHFICVRVITFKIYSPNERSSKTLDARLQRLSLSYQSSDGLLNSSLTINIKILRFQVLTAPSMMFRAVVWVVDNHFTRQYNPEDSCEHKNIELLLFPFFLVFRLPVVAVE